MSEFFNEIIGGKGSGGDGGASTQFWNPLAMPGEPKYQDIQAGVKKSGVFSIVDNETQFAIDQIPANTANSMIQFDDEPNIGWRIISSTALQSKYTTPAIVDDETILNATFPPSEQYSDYYCFVNSTNTYWQCKIVGTDFLWDNTGETTIDAISREEVNNLVESNSIFDRNRANHTGTQLASTISDFTESAQDAIGDALLDTPTIDLTYNDATNQISADVKDLSLTNSKIATNADIATSKINQNTVAPVDSIISNGMTQESINNRLQGQITATKNSKEDTANKTTTFSAIPTDIKFPTEKLLKDNLDLKVDKVAGKGLSDNNFTNAYKATLDNITEVVQDDVNALLIDSSTIVKTYDDNAGTLSLAIKQLSIDNTHISDTAGIETSKAKQSVITPVLAMPTNNDTQDVINNKSLGLINNLQSQIDTRPIGASNGNVYYLTSQASAIPNYELVSFSPDTLPLTTESVIINSTTAKASRLIHSYIANYEIGSAIINGGNWLFNFYGYVSVLNSSRFEIDILKRDIGGTETLLFTCETTDFLQIAQVSPELNIVNVETTQQDFACNTTDKIVIKIYGKTNRTQDTTITLLHSGTEYASHIHTPLIVSHNNLAGTQGGTATEKYHLSLADYNKVLVLDASLALKENVANKVSAFTATPNDTNYITELLAKTNFDLKVDKVVGKQLSTEDYTTAEKNKLAGIQDGAEVNVQANWSETNNTADSFILNKPTLGTVASKNVGTAIGNIQENGAVLVSLQTVETDASGKFITVVKNDAYNQTFGTGTNNVARGDASYLKADTYNKTQIDAELNNKLDTSLKGANGGLAELDSTGKVPSSQLPAYVDDVIEVANFASLPAIGETGKIYITIDTNLQYRWSGTQYVEISASLALGETSSTAYRGDRGKIAYDHSQTTGNPHGTTSIEISYDNVASGLTAINVKEAIDELQNEKEPTFTKNTAFNKNFGINANTVTEGNDARLGTKNIDETNIANNRIQVYNSVSGQLEYQDKPTGSTNLSSSNNTSTTIDINSDTGTDVTLQSATSLLAGLQSATDKSKLDGIQAGATQNSTDAQLRDRSTHTGTQTASTISDFQTSVSSNTDVLANTSARHTHPNKALLDTYTQTDANLSDAVAKKHSHANLSSLDLVSGTNTGDETTASIQLKRPIKTVASKSLEGTGDVAITKSDVGLSNVQDVDTTNPANITQSATYRFVSDTEKSTWNNKENAVVAGTTSQYYRGDKTFQTLDKSAVGLGNVDNTSDVNKPVSTAQQTALNLKADLNSPNLTGTPLAPTAPTNTNTTQIATTQFVNNQVAAYISAQDVEVLKGAIDCSTNPNYPAADAGWVYRVSVAGKIGGASGPNVEVGDRLECFVDSSASGTQAEVGANWIISHINIDGAVTSNETATLDNDFIVFSGTSGKVIKKVTLAGYKTLLALSTADVGLNNVPNTDATNLSNDTIQGTFTPANTAIVTGQDAKTAFENAQGQINEKANDSAVVHNTGNETIDGTKTFSSAPNLSSLTASQRLELDASKNIVSVAKNTADNQEFETTVGNIQMDGTASLGTSSNVPRSDHRHPSDTTKVDKTQTIAGNDLSGNITQDQITGLSTTGVVKRTGANTLGASALVNADVAAAANIATSKIQQETIAQTKAQPANNDTLDVINNKQLGLINTGTSVAPLAIANLATGGVIGTAAATVDLNRIFLINQTTTGQTLTLPNPTATTLGQIVSVTANSTASFTMYNSVIQAGASQLFIWNGSVWSSFINTFRGATTSVNGTNGAVPQPNAGQQSRGLRGDATWGITQGSFYGRVCYGLAAQLNGISTNTPVNLSTSIYTVGITTFQSNASGVTTLQPGFRYTLEGMLIHCGATTGGLAFRWRVNGVRIGTIGASAVIGNNTDVNIGASSLARYDFDIAYGAATQNVNLELTGWTNLNAFNGNTNIASSYIIITAYML